MGDNMLQNILFFVFILIIFPLFGGIVVQYLFFAEASPMVGLIWYLILNVVFWILTFTGRWYFMFSAGILTYMLVLLISKWGEASEVANVLHISFGG